MGVMEVTQYLPGSQECQRGAKNFRIKGDEMMIDMGIYEISLQDGVYTVHEQLEGKTTKFGNLYDVTEYIKEELIDVKTEMETANS